MKVTAAPKGQWERRLQTDIHTARQALRDALSLDLDPSPTAKTEPACAAPGRRHQSGFSSSAFCEAALVDMYAKCGDVPNARKVLDGIACPDTICSSSMVACYHRVGRYQEALALFSRMDKMGSATDQVSKMATGGAGPAPAFSMLES
ncbi:pentatricopeptide repeat-containing protein At3g21470-like [Oryza glaberrima]|uniref:pentatricopeptide repeat-containing protein At3g21470-like n=1 Tax=Oryza glaberrima TaxID=4538 RepID=UPI00224BE6BB|nr:pentatricopeptide repeat-containing protein At3g21470-like [Oryza glaberrima]